MEARIIIKNQWGAWGAIEEKGKIVRVFLPGSIPEEIENKPLSGTLLSFSIELEEYLRGKRKEFSVPIKLRGTSFQKKVWEEIKKIPYGAVKEYGEIADKLGNRKKARSVGGACNKNPIPIIIPCHRVIGKQGKLTGFGSGIELKKKLLDLEKRGM